MTLSQRASVQVFNYFVLNQTKSTDSPLLSLTIFQLKVPTNLIKTSRDSLLCNACLCRLWKKLEGGRKGHDRSRWLNSPNVYQKVEILETGTPDPKKITKVEYIKFEDK